jgi:hypothetical protein
MTAAPRPPAKLPPSRPNAEFVSSTGVTAHAHRIVIYGPGGIGKSSLAASAPAPKFIDLESGTCNIDTDRVGLSNDAEWSWSLLLAALRTPQLWDGVKTIVIDSATRAEELAIPYTLETIPNDKGSHVKNIEGYGYGKGYQYVYDTFVGLLAELDRHVKQGRNVVLICHDCTATVPNPSGDDWIRYEPRLQSPASGKASIRHRVREWTDHMFFVGYDIVTTDGKAKGCGTRTIFPTEMPTHVAKSRTLADAIAFPKDSSELWDKLFSINNKETK